MTVLLCCSAQYNSVGLRCVDVDRRICIGNGICGLACRRTHLRVRNCIGDRRCGILLLDCFCANSTISKGLVSMLGLMVGVVCNVGVHVQSRCRSLPRQMLVDVAENL